MSLVQDDELTTCNPATGSEVGRIKITPIARIPELVARARAAQRDWGQRPWKARRDVLTRWWEFLGREVDEWTRQIRDEIGKPGVEALAGDVVPTLDAL